MSMRDDNGLIDPEEFCPGMTVAPNKALYDSGSITVVFDDPRTLRSALRLAHGDRQRWELRCGTWNVDAEKWKLRERLESAGFEFEALGREYIDSPIVYRISRPLRDA